MSAALTDEQCRDQQFFREFAAEFVAPFADSFDRDQAISDETIAALRTHRLLGAHLPADQGGRGLDPISYGLLHDELGRACSSTRSLLTVHDMVCEAVWRLAGRQTKRAALEALTDGGQLGAFALSEPDAGSDAAGIRTTAVREGDDYIINGTKTWISFGQIADIFLVVAKMEDDTVGGLLVPAESPGVSIEPIRDMLGLRASMLATIEFENCTVPASGLVGSPRMPDGLLTGTALQLGRYSVAWGCVGIGEACSEASFRHAATRIQFGKPIADHQLVRRMLTDMEVDVRAARLLCLDAGRLMASRSNGAVQATLIAKYFASRMAGSVATDAVQVHGAIGVSAESPVGRHLRDARMMEIIEGSTQLHQVLIPRHRLKAGEDGRA
jgi:alkylation response protein AidB-like acyl-CoA dehydrogenase